MSRKLNLLTEQPNAIENYNDNDNDNDCDHALSENVCQECDYVAGDCNHKKTKAQGQRFLYP